MLCINKLDIVIVSRYNNYVFFNLNYKTMTWMSIQEFADKIGISKGQVYLDRKIGKIPKEKLKVIKKEVIRINYEENGEYENKPRKKQ